MPDLATRTLEMLGLLYATTLGVDRWPDVLDGIAELTGGNGALLFLYDPGLTDLEIAAKSSGYRDLHIEQYRKSLFEGDEAAWLHVLDQAPPRTIKTDLDVWPDRRVYDAMPSVRFLRTQALYHRVGVRPCAHGGWKDALTVLYREDRPVIRPVEARRLELLVPHLARAIEMQRPFRLLQRRFGQVLAALDRLGLGVLVVRAASEIVLANREAERILAADDGLARCARAKVGARDPNAAARLAAAVERAAHAARLEELDGSHTLEIPRRSGGEPYLVDVVPLRDDGDEMGSAFNGVLLVLIDPDHREMVSIQGLARSYALSPTETLVCRMIVQGMTQQEIADARGVSLDTVKSQARAIYTKTRTRNRAELVRRALSVSPPLVDGTGKRID